MLKFAVPCVQTQVESGMDVKVFDPFPVLEPGASHETPVHINFNNKMVAIKFKINTKERSFATKLAPLAGELTRAQVSGPCSSCAPIRPSGLRKTCSSHTRSLSCQLRRVSWCRAAGPLTRRV